MIAASHSEPARFVHGRSRLHLRAPIFPNRKHRVLSPFPREGLRERVGVGIGVGVGSFCSRLLAFARVLLALCSRSSACVHCVQCLFAPANRPPPRSSLPKPDAPRALSVPARGFERESWSWLVLLALVSICPLCSMSVRACKPRLHPRPPPRSSLPKPDAPRALSVPARGIERELARFARVCLHLLAFCSRSSACVHCVRRLFARANRAFIPAASALQSSQTGCAALSLRSRERD